MFEEVLATSWVAGVRAAVGRRGADLRFNMAISLEEAFAGKKTQIDVPSSVTCESCDGSGGRPAQAQDLPELSGTREDPCPAGFLHDRADLPHLRRRRQIIEDPCKICSGAGRVQREKTLSVDIPAGIEDGTRIRLRRGRGRPARRGSRRPLSLSLREGPPAVQARGADLYYGFHCR